MKKSYRIVTQKNSQGLADYLAQNGQLLLPMVELIEASRMAIDELIDILGRASMEAVFAAFCPKCRRRKATRAPRQADRLVRHSARASQTFGAASAGSKATAVQERPRSRRGGGDPRL